MRVFVALLVLSLSSGCWVIDELDSGMDVIDSHSREKKAKPQPRPEPRIWEPRVFCRKCGASLGRPRVDASCESWWRTRGSEAPLCFQVRSPAEG